MAQSPKGRLIYGLYKPIQGNCAIYFYLVYPHQNNPLTRNKGFLVRPPGTEPLVAFFCWSLKMFLWGIFQDMLTEDQPLGMLVAPWIWNHMGTEMGEGGEVVVGWLVREVGYIMGNEMLDFSSRSLLIQWVWVFDSITTQFGCCHKLSDLLEKTTIFMFLSFFLRCFEI